MNFFGHQKRQVPKPELIGPHHSSNPMFTEEKDWSAFRSRVVTSTGLGLVVAALGFLVYGPWFAITTITVRGTRLIDPQSIKRTTDTYLSGQRWLVLPNRTLWIVSSRGLSNHLEERIRQRISIEGVTVEKVRPHGLNVIIAERTPVAIWTNGSSFGSIDKQGKIIELRSGADPSLPLITDENVTIFAVDSSVVKQEVISSLQQLAGYLRRANIEVSSFMIPVPVCPAPVIPTVEVPTNSSGTNTNTNPKTNANQSNRNTNTALNALNANSVAPVTLPCDLGALRFSSQEIHVQLTQGPRVLFDRHADLQQAVQALQRVLSERSDKKYTSIDVRFGDRVYVK